MTLSNKNVLITGAARRIGRTLALAVARAGGKVIIHHGHSTEKARTLQDEIHSAGGESAVIQADLKDVKQTEELIKIAWDYGPLFALVNNAAIFEPLNWQNTDLDSWNRHIQINLTAPFLLSQFFARQLKETDNGRIVNMLDWRALRPGADHLPYTISKSSLAALTKSLAISLAPQITVNGLSLGAVLPPSDGGDIKSVLNNVPVGRWAEPDEIGEALMFLLDGPSYITGEILSVDGGRILI